jgi:hypothetical protein
VSGTKYYKVTEKELMALIATADSCEAISGDLDDEAKRAQKAIKSIGTLKSNTRGKIDGFTNIYKR